jgi:hypothetical protein
MKVMNLGVNMASKKNRLRAFMIIVPPLIAVMELLLGQGSFGQQRPAGSSCVLPLDLPADDIHARPASASIARAGTEAGPAKLT